MLNRRDLLKSACAGYFLVGSGRVEAQVYPAPYRPAPSLLRGLRMVTRTREEVLNLRLLISSPGGESILGPCPQEARFVHTQTLGEAEGGRAMVSDRVRLTLEFGNYAPEREFVLNAMSLVDPRGKVVYAAVMPPEDWVRMREDEFLQATVDIEARLPSLVDRMPPRGSNLVSF